MMKYNIGDQIRHVLTGQQGIIRGRAEYAHAEPSYHLVIVDDKGQAVFAWWEESLCVAPAGFEGTVTSAALPKAA